MATLPETTLILLSVSKSRSVDTCCLKNSPIAFLPMTLVVIRDDFGVVGVKVCAGLNVAFVESHLQSVGDFAGELHVAVLS